MTLDGIDTVIFDLDGTLYEDVRVYDRYAEEMARFLPDERQRDFLAEWQRAKEGQSVARVGMGYDVDRDLLFRFVERRVTAYVDWTGCELPRLGPPAGDAAGPPIESPAFGPGRLVIGDWWQLPDVLATHFGVSAEHRSVAFTETRALMESDEFQLRSEPGVAGLLDDLRARGRRLLAMSNSPAESVSFVLGELGLIHRFDLVLTDAHKPGGMRRYLDGVAHPERLLSVGDVYMNEVEPVLEAGGAGVYIDRHGTGFGSQTGRCVSVPSIADAISWLRRQL